MTPAPQTAGEAVPVPSPADAGSAVVLEVVKPGVQTTVQDLRGRTGLWGVGVPPSGAFDDLSFELANLAVGNLEEAAGLECVMVGPVLEVVADVVICVAGTAVAATLDGVPVVPGKPTPARAGSVLDMGKLTGPGMRGYLAVRGGIRVPPVLGSRATFVLGRFGGLAGRPLRRGDHLACDSTAGNPIDVGDALPGLTAVWQVRVLPGPHGAPEYLTAGGAADLFAAQWTVDHRSDRTGIRLTGPTPQWARADGGEAGLHPSNVHDSAYPVGGIMLSGDTPVIVGRDGPSLGGFVVPAVVIGADRWMLGQLRPGDSVRLLPVSLQQAERAMADRRAALADVSGPVWAAGGPTRAAGGPTRTSWPGWTAGGSEWTADQPAPAAGGRIPAAQSVTDRYQAVRAGELPRPLAELAASGHGPAVTVRLAGDRHVLVEAGPPEFDLTVRMWVHLLAGALARAAPAGVTEVVEGVRSLLVAVDGVVLRPAALADLLADLAAQVPDPTTVVLDVREVTLPIAFDHPAAHEAMARYQRSVYPDAPWCPDNVEFIRRINDLADRDEVFDIVSAATYLVVGLGDVYLGAPVAVPIDPRHRLVTTKYSPARTWTPQNAVGIGGLYLCVYGMEGPGGYQLVGRTVPVWRLDPAQPDRDAQPWLLRQFDRLRFAPVSTEELADLRADIHAGRADLAATPATFSLAEVVAVEAAHAAEISELRARRRAAFDAERQRWSR